MTSLLASLSPLPPLPSETLLQILVHLSLPDLASALRVNSSWFLLVQHHQQGIFRSMALSHGYLDEEEGELEMTLEELGARAGSLKGVESWRDVCYRRRTLDLNWSTASCLSDWKWNPSRDVWRIKADREEGTIITTGRRGGITVIDEKTSNVLWRKNDIHTHAHCEFGNGYLVFDSGDGNTHEVFRRTTDMIRDGQLPDLDEDEEQDASWRGHFSPFAILQSPGAIRAYRFVYPTLLIGSFNAQEAYLFDVPSKSLVATVDISSPDLDLINYVELTPSHILILGRRYLHVHSRHPPSSTTSSAQSFSNHILNFPSQPSAAEFSLDLALDFHPSTVFGPGGQQQTFGEDLDTTAAQIAARTAGGSRGMIVRRTRVKSAKAVLGERGEMSGRLGAEVFSNRVDYNFTAVHVSGNDLVLTSLLGKIFIVLDYAAVFEDPSLQSQHTICLDVEEPVYNLAFEGGRAVLTTKTKILLLNLSSLPTLESLRRLQQDRQDGKTRSAPPLRLELYAFGGVAPVAVNEISSVQMDEQRVMISYYCKADPFEDGFAPLDARMGTGFAIKMFDFSPSPSEPTRAMELVERRLDLMNLQAPDPSTPAVATDISTFWSQYVVVVDQPFGIFPTSTSLFWFKTLNLAAATAAGLGDGEVVQLFLTYEKYAGGPQRTALLGSLDAQHPTLDLKTIKIMTGERVSFNAVSSFRTAQPTAQHDGFRTICVYGQAIENSFLDGLLKSSLLTRYWAHAVLAAWAGLWFLEGINRLWALLATMASMAFGLFVVV